jgi:PAS domain S-box-containing protein
LSTGRVCGTFEKSDCAREQVVEVNMANDMLAVEADREAMSPGEERRLIRELRTRRDELERENAELHRKLAALAGKGGRSEKLLLRTIIDAVSDLIYVKDRDGVYLACNKASERFVGLTEAEQIGKTDFDFFDGEIAGRIRDVDRQIMASGTERRVEELMTYPDGSCIMLDTVKVPYCGPDGEVAGLVGISRDISELRRLSAQLAEMNMDLEQRVRIRTAELEHLNLELESFCYSISHELRAPIARLDAFSCIIAECVAAGDLDELVPLAERIGVSSRRLRTVVDALLQLNRISRAGLVRESVDLSGMARQIMDELLEWPANRHLTLSIEPGIAALGDSAMLRVCLRNLLENAVKYSAGEPRAVVEFGRDTQRDGGCYFVRDNGTGFDMAHADKLFEPFCRLHHDGEFEGNGIGLATVKRIIERHGGKVWAEAVAGGGATFYFTLGDSRREAS